jgi:hypothetical protein
MSTRAVLHIGTHKTGTTSLQHYLHEAQDVLASVDALYPPGFAIPTAHAELPLLAVRPERVWPARLRLPEVQDPNWLAAAHRYVREQVESSPARTIVLSHEDLSYVRFDDEHERLAALLAGLEVDVVVFLRDRRAFLESYAAQLDATGFARSDDPTSYAYVEQDSWLADYDALIHGYRRRFGASSVDVLDYDAVMVADGSVIPAFLERLGVERASLPPHEHFQLNRTGSNVRPTEAQLQAIRRRLADQARS